MSDTASSPAADQKYDFDVLVVGSGLVGACFACALADTGLRIGIVDKSGLLAGGEPASSSPETAQPRFETRVSAISPASRWILEQVGAWGMVSAQRHCPYTDMQVWEADGTGSIHFAAADIHVDDLGLIAENQVLLVALHECLRQLGNVRVLPAASLEALSVEYPGTSRSHVLVSLAGASQISTRLLVGADGSNSRVRDLAGFYCQEWDYQHHALVTTVRCELGHGNTALQRFMDSGILAFLPLREQPPGADWRSDAGQQRYCSIVWSAVPEQAARLSDMPDQEFRLALGAAIEHRLGRIEWVDSRQSFPLRQRHARSYVSENIALIGDAAHSIHPLAGQGVNLGLLDAWSLAGQLRKALEQQRGFAELRILKRYQRERIGHNLGMMWLMEGFKRLFADQPLALRWLRNAGMSGLDGLPAIKNRVMRQAMGLDQLK